MQWLAGIPKGAGHDCAIWHGMQTLSHNARPSVMCACRDNEDASELQYGQYVTFAFRPEVNQETETKVQRSRQIRGGGGGRSARSNVGNVNSTNTSSRNSV